MVRWLVTGAGGGLGTDLRERLAGMAADAVCLSRAELDISDKAAVAAALADVRPTIVVNAAAYTKVDDAEADVATALRVNATGPEALSRWCVANAARMVHVSTDYVFPGDAAKPYEVDDATGPKSAYGRTKLAGEQAVLSAAGDCHVVRTAWVYGAVGTNFMRTIGRRLRAGATVEVVDDQRGAPTWSWQLAGALIALGEADVEPGIWHCSSAGDASWYEVARALAEELDVGTSLVGRTTSETLARPAPRPSYSVLSNRKWIDAGLPPLPEWRDALRAAIAELGETLTG
jgi:dTDP-4-dehydrorhamnose reductase